jgi:hypothetical protein
VLQRTPRRATHTALYSNSFSLNGAAPPAGTSSYRNVENHRQQSQVNRFFAGGEYVGTEDLAAQFADAERKLASKRRLAQTPSVERTALPVSGHSGDKYCLLFRDEMIIVLPLACNITIGVIVWNRTRAS